MSGNFAGSASLDERRRRRLVATAEVAPPTESSATREAQLHDQIEDDTSFDPTAVMLSDLVPSDVWKTAAVVSALFLLTAGLIVASLDSALLAGQYGQAAAHFFDPVSGRALRFLSVAAFISAAHIAFVIGTIRSRSPRDFRGRFRIWYWAAGLFVGGATLVGTDLQIVFSDLVHQWTGLTYRGSATLNWLVPLLVVSSVITWKLWLDMRLCRSSQVFLALGILSGIALVFSGRIEQQIGFDHVALLARLSLGVNLLAAMLLHVRFVGHVNPNPPEPKPTRQQRSAAEPSSQKADTNPKRQPPAPKRQPKKSRKRQPVLRDVEDYEEYEEQVTQPTRRRKRTRRDGPAAESLKGLTKKQRKQARKEFRDQQRARDVA